MIEEPEEERSSWKRRGGIAVALALVALALGYGLYRVVHNASGPQRRVQEIVTLRLIQPPPPPPPPPQIPKPPEPQKMLEQPQEQKPMQRAKAEDHKPPPQPLALDAKGGPGSDSFGLGGRPGGSDLIGGDGGGTSRFGWYADIVQTQIQDALQKDEKLRTGEYRIVLSVWLSSDGRATRVKLVHSTGDHAVDSRIEELLADLPALPQAPPHDMPQPVDLRIDARATR